MFGGLEVEKELHVRQYFSSTFLSLSPIIVLDELKNTKLEIFCDAITYDDVRELLAQF